MTIQFKKTALLFAVASALTLGLTGCGDEAKSDVKVIKVTTTTIHAKEKRVGANPSGMTATRKKAVVKLSADSKNIEIFEGMV